jgi:anti-anti-sigma regulatory factor
MIEIDESGDQATITVRGAIGIAGACMLRDALLPIQDRWSSLIVNLEDMTEIDVSGLQLLCAAHRTAVKLHKQVTLTGHLAESVHQSAANAGFLKEQACAMGGGQACLWAGRKKQ